MIRITAGEWKGRALATPPNLTTRPTQARLRQAMFNSIQFEIPDSNVLDLFAGSGSLAFEALSRGASRAVLVENHRVALEMILKNARTLEAIEKVRVLKDDVFKSLPTALKHGPYDFVFADPPYAEGYEMRLLTEVAWPEVLLPGGLFLLEWGVQKSKFESVPDETDALEKIREKGYGETVLTTYRRKP